MGFKISCRILCYCFVLLLCLAHITGEPEEENDSKSKDKTDKLVDSNISVAHKNTHVSKAGGIHGHHLEFSSDQSLYKYFKYKMAHSDFVHGFIAALSMIIVSELGDKTFFIAAIMSMRHSRTVVLAGALGALVAMTILSALLGFATTIIPRNVTHYISALLFAVFGIKMLKDGWSMSPDEAQEEYEEVQAEIKKKEDEMNTTTQDIETGIIRGPKRNFLYLIFSAVFLEAFILTFLAEWGDRSQIATIILAAREDVWGVILGGCIGHAICTGLAVIAGRVVAAKISARSVTLIGGVVFILFAITAFMMGPD